MHWCRMSSSTCSRSISRSRRSSPISSFISSLSSLLLASSSALISADSSSHVLACCYFISSYSSSIFFSTFSLNYLSSEALFFFRRLISDFSFSTEFYLAEKDFYSRDLNSSISAEDFYWNSYSIPVSLFDYYFFRLYIFSSSNFSNFYSTSFFLFIFMDSSWRV